MRHGAAGDGVAAALGRQRSGGGSQRERVAAAGRCMVGLGGRGKPAARGSTLRRQSSVRLQGLRSPSRRDPVTFGGAAGRAGGRARAGRLPRRPCMRLRSMPKEKKKRQR
jgi:hypothetical protein